MTKKHRANLAKDVLESLLKISIGLMLNTWLLIAISRWYGWGLVALDIFGMNVLFTATSFLVAFISRRVFRFAGKSIIIYGIIANVCSFLLYGATMIMMANA